MHPPLLLPLKRFALAPLTLRLFAILFVLAGVVALVIAPSPLLGIGVVLSIVADALGGQPWYEMPRGHRAPSISRWSGQSNMTEPNETKVDPPRTPPAPTVCETEDT